MSTRDLYKRLLIEIYVPSVVLAISRVMISFTLPLYMIYEAKSYFDAALVITYINLGALIIDPFTSYVLTLLGIERSNILSLAVISVSTLLINNFLTSTSSYLLTISLIAFGAGRSLWNISRKYLIATEIPREIRGRASSFIGASERIGLFAGPAIVGFVISRWSYSYVFTLAFLMSIAILATALFSRIPREEIHDDNNDLNKISSGSSQVEKESLPVRSVLLDLVILFIVLFIVQGIRSVRNYMLPLIGKESTDLSSDLVSYLITLTGLFDVLMSYPAGWLMDKKGRSVAVSLSFGIIALSYLLLQGSANREIYIAGLVIYGAGNGLGAGTMITIGSDISRVIGSRRIPHFLMLWQTLGDLSTIIFPVITGLLTNSLGVRLTCVILSILSLLVVLLINRIKKDLYL